jgi:hypothetical protein
MDVGKRLLAELAHRLVLVSPDRMIRVAIDGAAGAMINKPQFTLDLECTLTGSFRCVVDREGAHEDW